MCICAITQMRGLTLLQNTEIIPEANRVCLAQFFNLWVTEDQVSMANMVQIAATILITKL